MAITTFDTLKFVRRLEEAGIPSQQAEVQAEVLTEAFNVNLESLVTKDYLAVEFAKQFAEQNTGINDRFSRLEARMDTRFAEQRAELESKINVLTVMVGIVLTAVVIPYLERLLAL